MGTFFFFENTSFPHGCRLTIDRRLAKMKNFYGLKSTALGKVLYSQSRVMGHSLLPSVVFWPRTVLFLFYIEDWRVTKKKIRPVLPAGRVNGVETIGVRLVVETAAGARLGTAGVALPAATSGDGATNSFFFA